MRSIAAVLVAVCFAALAVHAQQATGCSTAKPCSVTFQFDVPNTGGAATGVKATLDGKDLGNVTSGTAIPNAITALGTHTAVLTPFNATGNGTPTTITKAVGLPVPGPVRNVKFLTSCELTDPPDCSSVVVP